MTKAQLISSFDWDLDASMAHPTAQYLHSSTNEYYFQKNDKYKWAVCEKAITFTSTELINNRS